MLWCRERVPNQVRMSLSLGDIFQNMYFWAPLCPYSPAGWIVLRKAPWVILVPSTG